MSVANAMRDRQANMRATSCAIVLLLCAALAPGLARTADAGSPWQETWTSPDEAQQVYGSQAETIELAKANELLLELVNKERRERRLSELSWDPLAAQVAQEQAAEMATRHVLSHYSMAGLKCEARFNALGGVDQITENTGYYEINLPVYLTPQLVRRMHGHWMASQHHRANIFDPAHTHLGAGFAIVLDGGNAYAAGVVEFINDYGDYSTLPERAKAGDMLNLSGTLDPRRAKLLYIGLGSQTAPIAGGEAYKHSDPRSYSPPEVELALVPSQYLGSYLPEQRERRYSVDYDEGSGQFSVQLELPDKWTSRAYYITVWARTPGQRSGSFCTMTQVVLVK